MKGEINFARLSAVLIAGLLSGSAADAQIANNRIRVGVLSDLAGIYEQNAGNGSVEAARIAAEEFGGKINGATIEIIAGDHQNKPDVGASVVNRWFDVDGVDMVTDLVNSAVGFAVVDVAKAKNKTVILTSAGSADFTGKACAPDHSIHWIYDTYQMGKSMGVAVPELGKTWFFITADYAFGHALEGALANSIKPYRRHGGRLGEGAARHQRLLGVRAAGAGVGCPGHRDQQWRRRCDQCRKSRTGVRPAGEGCEGCVARPRLAAGDQERQSRCGAGRHVRDHLVSRICRRKRRPS